MALALACPWSESELWVLAWACLRSEWVAVAVLADLHSQSAETS